MGHHFQPQTFTTTKQNHLHKPSRCNSRLSPSSPSPQPSPAKVSSTQSPPILVEPSQPQPQSLGCRFECHLRSWWSPLIRNFQCCLPRLIHRIRRIQRSILHLFRSLVSRLIPLICCFCSKHIYHSYRRCRLIVACQSPEQHLCCPEQSRKLGQLESLECCFQRK